MSVPAGTRLGPYEVIAPIGAGGMGEVYKARDPRLGREVAIKVLPAGFSADPERLRRFEQEARAAAALNHPNILAVYDIGVEHGAPYIVSELLAGQTLRARLGQPAASIAIKKSIDCAVQISRGLSAAHDKGIVHRDLKPENVFVTSDGQIKILDFGLAKLTQPERGDGSRLREQDPSPSASDAATTMASDTQPGLLLGTMGYMAPEQARGLAVDSRADIFAFGAMLYEMLSGQRAFAGATPADTISAILEKNPADLPVAEHHIPPALARIVDRCLEKDPGARFQSTRDLTFALEALESSSGVSVTSAQTAVPTVRRGLGWKLVAGVSLLVAAVLAWPASQYLLHPAVEPALVRLEVVTPPTGDPLSFALSASGRQLAFVANVEGGSRLFVRSLNDGAARSLEGTDGAAYPFWSPDSGALGFFAEGKLKRVDLSGGAPQVLADAPAARGGSWSRNGTILFAPSTTSGLMRMSSTGGPATSATTLVAGQNSHRWPQFLPDGRRFIFLVAIGLPDMRGEYLGALEGDEPKRLMPAETAPLYTPGYLLQVSQGVLAARPFDPDRPSINGDPIVIAQPVGVDSAIFRGAVAVSDTGVLAHRNAASGRRQLQWVDRAGKLRVSIGAADDTGLASPELSPDGRRTALHRAVGGNTDVWIVDLTRGLSTRFTFDPVNDMSGVWSPDGTRVVFRSNRHGHYDLFQKSSNMAADEQLLLTDAHEKNPLAWSSDGQFLLYAAPDPKTGSDLWALPLTGDPASAKPFPVVQTAFDDVQGQFSPNGRWLAYASNETARWSRDGRELYYASADGQQRTADSS